MTFIICTRPFLFLSCAPMSPTHWQFLFILILWWRNKNSSIAQSFHHKRSFLIKFQAHCLFNSIAVRLWPKNDKIAYHLQPKKKKRKTRHTNFCITFYCSTLDLMHRHFFPRWYGDGIGTKIHGSSWKWGAFRYKKNKVERKFAKCSNLRVWKIPQIQWIFFLELFFRIKRVKWMSAWSMMKAFRVQIPLRSVGTLLSDSIFQFEIRNSARISHKFEQQRKRNTVSHKKIHKWNCGEKKKVGWMMKMESLRLWVWKEPRSDDRWDCFWVF